MFYFVYSADRPGAGDLRWELREPHWAYMDGFADALYVRGPTLSPDRSEATGSLHILDLPSDGAALAFAHDEPYWRAGVFASVQVLRYEDRLGRSMWDFPGPPGERFLAVAPAGRADADATSPGLIALGDLTTFEGEPAGFAACYQGELPLEGAGLTVRPWQFGGRPASPLRPVASADLGGLEAPR